MAVLVNKQTGAAEDLAPELAQQAMQAGTHTVPLVDKSGQIGSAPMEEAQSLIAQGYRQPDANELTSLLDHAKYNSTTEQLKTAAEGAASAATFGLSSGIEAGLLDNAEEQRKRREYNPGVHMAGQAAGLLGSMAIPGFGAANLLTKAGQVAVPAMGATAAARMGTAAARAAVENMVFQAGDEVSKAFIGDPHQSVETAAVDIGLAGLLGAGFGGAAKGTSELWKLGPGRKVESLLTAMQKRADGVPFELKDAAGIEISPNIEAALTDNPQAKQMLSTLLSSDSKAGRMAQADFAKLRSDLDGAAAVALGKNADDIAGLASLSKADVGAEMSAKLQSTLDAKVKPINEAYSAISSKYSAVPLDDAIKGAISTEIANYATSAELKARSSDMAWNLANKVMEKMNEQNTAESLRLFTSDLRSSNPFTKPETWKVAKDIASIIDEARESVIEAAAGRAGGEAAVGELRAAKDAYKALMQTVDALDERLHVGNYQGPESFMKALAQMGPEKIAQRLNVAKDTRLQSLLDSQFPEIADAVKAYERNKLAKAALDSTGNGIDVNKLLKAIDKLEPEARDWVLPAEGRMQLNALAEIANQIPDPKTFGNPSGTARVLDRLWKHLPASTVGMLSMALGNHPATAILMGQLSHWLGKEAPDAVKMAMLKFMSTGAPVSGPGFQAAVKQAAAVLRGEAALNKSIKAVFDVGRIVAYEPTAKERSKLKEQVDKFSASPELMIEDMDEAAGHYTPEHAAVMGEAAARNIAYLASIRPDTTPLGPLDPPRKPNAVEEAKYNRALDIAQQPLLVLGAVKKGSVTIADITHLQTMYPALYGKMQNKLMDQLIEAKTSKKQVPYSTKMGLSVFMGQPLDASMRKESILASFNSPVTQSLMSMGASSKATPARADKLSKLPSAYSTPDQARELNKQTP